MCRRRIICGGWRFTNLHDATSRKTWIFIPSVLSRNSFAERALFSIFTASHVSDSLLTYLLTPWSSVLLEKLTVSAASQEIPRIFGTRRFITVLTSARHMFLSWANSIQSPQPPPTSRRSILILFSNLRLGLPNGLFRRFRLLHFLISSPDSDHTRHMAHK